MDIEGVYLTTLIFINSVLTDRTIDEERGTKSKRPCVDVVASLP